MRQQNRFQNIEANFDERLNALKAEM